MSKLAAAATVLVAACGQAAGADGLPKIPGMPSVVVVRAEDARLASASHELRARIGHEVSVEVDPALLREHAPALEPLLADAFETIARGIDQAREADPKRVSETCESLATVRFELDERRRDGSVYVDGDRRQLVVRVPSSATFFATESRIATALTDK